MTEEKVTRRAKPRRGLGAIRVHSQRRDEVDMRKLARLLIALARQDDNDQHPTASNSTNTLGELEPAT